MSDQSRIQVLVILANGGWVMLNDWPTNGKLWATRSNDLRFMQFQKHISVPVDGPNIQTTRSTMINRYQTIKTNYHQPISTTKSHHQLLPWSHLISYCQALIINHCHRRHQALPNKLIVLSIALRSWKPACVYTFDHPSFNHY